MHLAFGGDGKIDRRYLLVRRELLGEMDELYLHDVLGLCIKSDAFPVTKIPFGF
jgi:hypothetical protein